MKSYNIYIWLFALCFQIEIASAQTINWANEKTEGKHILSANTGLEHGWVYGIGYSYHCPNRLFPFVAQAEFSLPAGNQVIDDFKTKIGGQIRLIEMGKFQFSTKMQSVFRRYENDYVRLASFGSDISGVLGYYRAHWFVSAEFGFDKAIVTHFKNSSVYKEQYPAAVNGWYEPPSGGNFYYGLQTGISFKHHDVFLRAGKFVSEDFKSKPSIPFYGQLGYNLKF